MSRLTLKNQSFSQNWMMFLLSLTLLLSSCASDRLVVSRISPHPLETKGAIRLAQDSVDVYVDGDDKVIEATGMANYILIHESDLSALIKRVKERNARD